jgi:hypothetical protein
MIPFRVQVGFRVGFRVRVRVRSLVNIASNDSIRFMADASRSRTLPSLRCRKTLAFEGTVAVGLYKLLP